MSDKELGRPGVLEKVREGRLSQRAAGGVLGLSERQVRRLLRVFERDGVRGLTHKGRGRPSNRRLEEGFKREVMGYISSKYVDFGPTLAVEYLWEDDGLKVSKETVRKLMIEAGLRVSRKRKEAAIHPPRERRGRLGELVQIDGSLHDWFEGRGPKCCLIAFIDDASSRLMYGCFVPAETSQAYMDGVAAYVLRYGCPAAFYNDRHGIFTKHNPEDGEPTQFQRALRSLGIEDICALTPQAKGRVERTFQTHQDRLVKGLRLKGVSDIEGANEFLVGYLEKHNRRFAVSPREEADAHIAYLGTEEELSRICAPHFKRVMSKDLVVSYKRRQYVIQTGGRPRYALKGSKVEVVEYPDGRVELWYGRENLPYKVLEPAQRVAEPADEKTLNARVDEALKRRARWSEKSRPAQNHPWRRPLKAAASGAGPWPRP